MIDPIPSEYLVPFDGRFAVAASPTVAETVLHKDDAKHSLHKVVRDIDKLQSSLYAEGRRSLLLVFQAMDAAGKDGTIRALLTGVNPAGVQISAFKAPTASELDHDFLWRTHQRLPPRGFIGVFNRSYYEEVLVVRVHPEYLKGQRLPPVESLEQRWEQRFEAIRHHEQHLARSGTTILKFWLNVSREAQRERLLSRLEEPEARWKFNAGDLTERAAWPDYQHAYREALRNTSRPWAPWYAIPADHKPTARLIVARIVRKALRAMDPQPPAMSADDLGKLDLWREQLAPPPLDVKALTPKDEG